ncbi:hypothetical protein BU24DRAFT_81275 [Aaosphaeria arxii CBS 175.79]|uniref:Apple domain-containing protein n=1 Tax=Aaosphaeria arxii CBS 175.79 TaxID=1450172 RepID=A0A6A5X9J6_9PLEO|nr:uncharacterized protein BU24DRAFT_81275 [Aaosphaeria arxii CBS 175.79]KAF2009715.1 hypothetical protein BU24DRAFT_81275 [Aaosphaeria arxii CBS 175.79]
MSDLPQPVNLPSRNSFSAPEYAHYEGAKHFTDDTSVQATKMEHQGWSTSEREAFLQQPKAFSIERRTLWILLGIVILLIAAGVGGGVGGSMAVQNSKCKSINATNSAQPSPTPTSSATNNTILLSDPREIELVSGCPDSNIASTYDEKNYFSCRTRTGSDGNDVMAVIAFSVEGCLEACMSYNTWKQTDKECVRAVYARDLKKAFEKNFANCWLKGENNGQIIAERENVILLDKCSTYEECSKRTSKA